MGDQFDPLASFRELLARALGGQNQGSMPGINQTSTMSNLLPQGSALDPGAVAGANTLASAGNGNANPSFLDGMMGWTGEDGVEHNGWGSAALGAGQGLLSGYLGMKQYGLAKDQLAEGKRQFNQNFEAQRQTTNTRLEDRQRARRASNRGAYQSVGDYMNEHGV